jgi:hypothetical protein
MNILGGGFRVEQADGFDAEGNKTPMRVLVLVDPHSGISVSCGFTLDKAADLAAQMTDKPAIAVVPASAMPPKVRG